MQVEGEAAKTHRKTLDQLRNAGLEGEYLPAIEERTIWEQTFGRVPVGASLLMADSEGSLELADNQGDAARRLGLTLDRPARIRSA